MTAGLKGAGRKNDPFSAGQKEGSTEWPERRGGRGIDTVALAEVTQPRFLRMQKTEKRISMAAASSVGKGGETIYSWGRTGHPLGRPKLRRRGGCAFIARGHRNGLAQSRLRQNFLPSTDFALAHVKGRWGGGGTRRGDRLTTGTDKNHHGSRKEG